MNSSSSKSFLAKPALKFCPFLALCILLGTDLMVLRPQSAGQTPALSAGAKTSGSTNEIAALQSEIQQLKGKLPDQSHAMADVGYHFSNLWFAGQKKNWPLAKFYLDETRSHLKWAVRIIPVRKTSSGDLDLQGILEAIDNTFLGEIGRNIENRDLEKFTGAYRQALEGCYACHKAAEKPFLRPQIPIAPPQPIINFDPGANWPE